MDQYTIYKGSKGYAEIRTLRRDNNVLLENKNN